MTTETSLPERDHPRDRTMAVDDRTEELFHAALQQTGDVTAFLREACGRDVVLFESVHSLVRAAGGHHRILDQPISIGSSLKQQVRPDRRELNLTSGDLLDNYHLLRPLGKGGMGTVFLARELSPIQRDVAIKLTNHQVDDPNTESRLANERQTLAALNHPSIPTIFNAGTTADDHTYLVLEYIDGTPIARYCRQTSASLTERLQLFARLCDTIAYVHDQGIIHRDLKSANVLVTIDGENAEPCVVDFGIAKRTGLPSTDHNAAALPGVDTQHGDLVGTPGCMSPEQYLPGFAAPDHRSDVYSLGLLLYRLLVDQTPFPTSCVNEVDQRTTLQHPPAPSALHNTACDAMQWPWPAELDDIALRCIQLQPEDRYTSVRDLQTDIESVTQSLTAATVTLPPAAAPHKPARRSSRPTVSTRRSSLRLLLSALVVGLFAPALNSLQSQPQMARMSDVASPAVQPQLVTPNVVVLQSETGDRSSQTFEVDDETYGQIAALLGKQGLLPLTTPLIVTSGEGGVETVSTGREVGLAVAHNRSDGLPVTANSHASSTPREKQSG